MLYSVSRGFIEILRTDSLMIFGLKTASLISIILFLFGLILFIKTKNSHPEVFKK
jgi:phosphatidylglycerol:prolipoprotein diacylglycerol transferase